MRIGIDFDSTIAKIDQPWLDRLNKLRGTSYCAEDWVDWDLTFLRPQDRDVFFSLFTPDIYDEVEPYRGAADAIRKIARKKDVELLCVTSSPKHQANEFLLAKRNWLRRYVPELADTVIEARSKSGLGLDFLIDDAPHHHKKGDYVPILVERPWNRSVASKLRFKDWIEGEALLLTLIAENNNGGKIDHEQRST